MKREKRPQFSKVEIAKLAKSARAVLPPGAYRTVKRNLMASCADSTEAEVDRAIEGLSQEDEFAMMCSLMGTVTHLVHLEQRPIISGDFIIPDFMARFAPSNLLRGQVAGALPERKYFVDVKSTDKDELKISGSLLRRRRNFATEFGLPLLFAVRFTGYPRYPAWAMVEDSDPSKPSLSVTFADAFNGLRRHLWDDYSFTLAEDELKLETVFSDKARTRIVSYSDYGWVTEHRLIYRGVDISTDEPVKASLRYIFFERLTEEVEVKRIGSQIVQTRVPAKCVRSVSDMLYYFNRMWRDDPAEPHVASSALAQSDRDGGVFILSRKLVEGTTLPLLRAGVLKLIEVDAGKSEFTKVNRGGWDEWVVTLSG